MPEAWRQTSELKNTVSTPRAARAPAYEPSIAAGKIRVERGESDDLLREPLAGALAGPRLTYVLTPFVSHMMRSRTVRNNPRTSFASLLGQSERIRYLPHPMCRLRVYNSIRFVVRTIKRGA
jgi:hypothetical protein